MTSTTSVGLKMTCSSTRQHLRNSRLGSVLRLVFSPISAEMPNSNFLLGEEVQNATFLNFGFLFCKGVQCDLFFLERLSRFSFFHMASISHSSQYIHLERCSSGLQASQCIVATFNDSAVALQYSYCSENSHSSDMVYVTHVGRCSLPATDCRVFSACF